jgi:hypothetical protein
MKRVNQLHKAIKFKRELNHGKKSTMFLDTTVTTRGRKFVIDLYRKETDKVQYLLPSSCHPSNIFKNVLYSRTLTLVRICTEKEDLKKRLSELKGMLQ